MMEENFKKLIQQLHDEYKVCTKDRAHKKRHHNDQRHEQHHQHREQKEQQKEHQKEHQKESDESKRPYKIRKQFIMDELSNDRKFSQAVVVDYLDLDLRRVYVAGQASPYPDEPNQGDFQAAIDKVYSDIERYVELAGGEMSDLVETMLISPGEWTDEKQEALQNTRTRVFGEDSVYPTSTAILAGLVFTTLLVEVKAVAEFRIPKRWRIKAGDDLIVRTRYQ